MLWNSKNRISTRVAIASILFLAIFIGFSIEAQAVPARYDAYSDLVIGVLKFRGDPSPDLVEVPPAYLDVIITTSDVGEGSENPIGDASAYHYSYPDWGGYGNLSLLPVIVRGSAGDSAYGYAESEALSWITFQFINTDPDYDVFVGIPYEYEWFIETEIDEFNHPGLQSAIAYVEIGMTAEFSGPDDSLAIGSIPPSVFESISGSGNRGDSADESVSFLLSPNQTATLTFYNNVWGDAEHRGGEVPPVPEPATMLLLGSGLIGLAAFRRKFRKS